MKRGKKINSIDLGIDLKSHKESEIFKWFLACLLFGKPIQQEVAKRAYFEFIKEKLDDPDAILEAGWDKLVQVLDRGHYVRFDFSTATKLLDICKASKEQYGGKVSNIYKASKNREELCNRLLAFKGIGPKTVEIFVRDMDPIWYK